jgi:Uma2 family endonuclease
MEPKSVLGDEGRIEYPDSDGQPMADNTRQFQNIVTIHGNIDALLAGQEAFVAGDILWYPEEGHPEIRIAPDVLVALGRPRGHRGSYQQWREEGAAPQVVWEVWSPSNTRTEMDGKRTFYEKYGVEEYYEYDPDRGILRGWVRRGPRLVEVERMEGHVSPLLGVRMGLREDELALYRPDGTRFLTFFELDDDVRRARESVREERLAREAAERAAEAAERMAEAERQAREAVERVAEAERQARAVAENAATRERLEREAARQQATQERQSREAAERVAAQERQERAAAERRAADAEALAARLAERLRALGIDPEQVG